MLSAYLPRLSLPENPMRQIQGTVLGSAALYRHAAVALYPEKSYILLLPESWDEAVAPDLMTVDTVTTRIVESLLDASDIMALL